MIVVVVGVFSKPMDRDPAFSQKRILTHFCYDAESSDDAKRDFLVMDACLKNLNEGFWLECLHVHAADSYAIIEACKEAAQASFGAILEAVKQAKAKAEGGEEE